MNEFVYIKNSADDGFEPAEEIIRTENLIKVTKWHDDEEDKIVFDFYDDIRGEAIRYTCKCASREHRDRVFRWYNNYLCEGSMDI